LSAILGSLREAMSGLKPKERQLARFILEHSGEIQHLGITELAVRSQTSAATISRFCRALHFAGYSEFKMKLAAELARQPVLPVYRDLSAGDPLPRIVEAIQANHIRSISDTTRLLDTRELKRAVDALQRAGKVDLYGEGTSGVVAYDLYLKLVRIGKPATAFTDPHMQITSASHLSSSDVAVAISYSGETPETADALRCAKESGATTISLTKYGATAISAMADIRLYASSLEEGMRRGDMASRIAQLHVVDILFTSLISEDYGWVPKLERAYDMARKYRNDKGR